jgi:ABC-type multidrug transport system ATPase subunit
MQERMTEKTVNLQTDHTKGDILITEALSKRFNREWIFRNFSFQFKAGGKYVFTGPNGSGKSTMLQVLWGQTPQTSGVLKYQIDGRSISVDDLAEHISIVAPYMDLIEEFTLVEQLEFHFKLKKIRSGVSVADLSDIMYLSQSREKFIANFSSGMKQRLKLGLAFYSQCNFLFIDEPGTNLDEAAFQWYKDQLKLIPQNVTILMASNNAFEYDADYEKMWMPDLR